MSSTLKDQPALITKTYWIYLPIIVALILFPLLVKTYFVTRIAIMVGIYAINVCGLSLASQYGGLFSLGHAAFFAFGAYVSAILTVTYKLNPWFAMVAACFVTILFAYLFTVPFLKLRRTYFVMATLGLGEVVWLLAKNLSGVTGGVMGIPDVPYLNIGSVKISEDWQILYMVGAFAIASIFLSQNIAEGRLGRAYRAIKTNETAASAMGINVHWELVRVFCFSACLSAISGSLLAHFLTFVGPELFTVHYSLIFLIFVVIGGQSVWGGLVVTVILSAMSEIFRGMEELSVGLYGLLLVLTFFGFPKGLAVLFPNRYAKIRDYAAAFPPHSTASNAREVSTHDGRPQKVSQRSVMEFSGISKTFGGTQALTNVNGNVEYGQILGIIGPNGAGKTTLLNVLSGFLSPEQGEVIFQGQDVTGRPPHLRAHMGVGRTFQISNLFTGMTVIENVMVGGHIRGTSGLLGNGVNSPKARREESTIMQPAIQSLEFLGLLDRAHEIVENIPFGAQKLVEIARALTLKPKLLLLDEPASGLNTAETEALARLIRKIKDEGIGVIIVEHNMPLIMGISDHVLVLDFGLRIAFGTPQEVSADETVIKAYLGKERRHA